MPLLTLGVAVGLVRLVVRDDAVDALIAATAATWLVWCAYLGLRLLARLGAAAAPRTSRSPASSLVVVVRLALPATHFA